MIRGAAITKKMLSVIRTGHTSFTQNERNPAQAHLAASQTSTIHARMSMTRLSTSQTGYRL